MLDKKINRLTNLVACAMLVYVLTTNESLEELKDDPTTGAIILNLLVTGRGNPSTKNRDTGSNTESRTTTRLREIAYGSEEAYTVFNEDL